MSRDGPTVLFVPEAVRVLCDTAERHPSPLGLCDCFLVLSDSLTLQLKRAGSDKVVRRLMDETLSLLVLQTGRL